jgi:hypothetical protein
MSERFHVDADREGDICIVDENGLTAARLVRGDKDGERYQLETARLLAASGELADALSLALTWMTDPGATDGKEAVERDINAALNAAVEE